MGKEKALAVLNENAANGSICSDLVALLSDNYENVDTIRDTVSRQAGKRYFESLERARLGM